MTAPFADAGVPPEVVAFAGLGVVAVGVALVAFAVALGRQVFRRQKPGGGSP